MTTATGFAITLAFPSGEPDGLSIVEKLGWSGTGVVFPRAALTEACDQEALQRPGVYILWDAGEEYPRVYIGQSENPSTRMYNHDRDEDKQFWTRGAVFSGGLDAAHARYLEASLVELAEELKRCDRGNDNTPSKPALSVADELHAKGFLENVLLCLPVIGVNFFEQPRVPARVQDTSQASATHGTDPTSTAGQTELILTGAFGVDARGYNGSEFVVLAGSKASRTEHSSISAIPRVAEQRQELLRIGVLTDDGEVLVFTQDYAFNSPSRAAAVCLARTSNGWTEWKDGRGRSLRGIE